VKRLGDIWLFFIVGLIVIAATGDAVARLINAVAVPGCVLLVALIVARLVWFYTTRW
jgi:hypothetical protein